MTTRFLFLFFVQIAVIHSIAQVPVMRLDTTFVQIEEDSITLQLEAYLENAGNDTVEVLGILAGGNSATNNVDFQVSGLGLLQWLPNDSAPKSINIQVFEDEWVESDEQFRIRFLPISTGFQIADTSFRMNILNDDSLEVSFSGAGKALAENEGSTNFSVTLNGLPTQAIAVNVFVNGGDADSGLDYKFADTTVVFQANDSSRIPLEIEVVDDAVSENSEQVIIRLEHAEPEVKYGIRNFTLTIVDDEPVGIFNQPISTLKLYPNPATDRVFIPELRENTTVSLFNIMGKELECCKVGKSLKWNNLPSGTYFVVVSGKGRVEVAKLSIQ